MEVPRVFESALALAELPYFELRDDERLVISELITDPIVDVHTHLALSYLRREPSVDLWREHSRTEHYLPVEQRFDMEVYACQNYSAANLKRMKHDLTLGSLTRSGMRRTHTVPNIQREMAELGVVASVLLPIDFPWLSWNAETYLGVVSRTTGFIGFGSVHPYDRDVVGKINRQQALGARGVKVHPAIQLLPADNERAMALYRHCADLGLLVLWHCGPVGIEPALGRHFSQLKHYWRAVRENPRTTFILGHSGALQFEMGLELAQRYDNVYLETSSQELAHVRRIVDEAPPERVLFGSDWPFYHQAMPLAKLLIATEGKPGARRRILWENAAQLFRLQQ